MLVRWSPAIALASALALSACQEMPEAIGVGAFPSDASAPVPPARYEPVTEGMRDYKVVNPKPWGQINQRVTPKSK